MPHRELRASMQIQVWPDPDGMYLREDSHTLVYGVGSSGKAKFALYLAMAERLPLDQKRGGDTERSAPDRSRTLVVSFLYDAKYYDDIAKRIAGRGTKKKDGIPSVDTIAFYPGLVAPETVANKILTAIGRAKLEGKPYRAVLLDGIHNTLLQFPLLEMEPLLWPTIARSLREVGIDLISTFTFFEVSRRTDSDSAAERRTSRPSVGPGGRLAAAQEAFFHLLVGQCDYTFSVERPQGKHNQNLVRVVAESSIDALTSKGQRWWDPRELKWSSGDPDNQ